MPILNGLEAAKILKSRYKDIKIIVLTGDLMTSFNESQHRCIVDAILLKPCSRQTLQRYLTDIFPVGTSKVGL